MSDWKNFFTNSTIRYIDQSRPGDLPAAIASFAVDDTLAISVGNYDSPTTVRLWVHDQTVVLGIPDTRLPHIEAGLEWLRSQGYYPVVRNSGGLAVVLDEGVLNMTLILPDVKKISIHESYEAMVDFTKYLFRDVTSDIKALEITDSYCPGEYDLSINGKKFAGISQRRVKNGSAVQIYLCVEGDGSKRAELIKEFYKRGLQGEKGNFNYPSVNPESMKSLSELLNIELTVSEVRDRILAAITQLASAVETNEFTEQELIHFNKRMEQMIDRNKKADLL